MTTMEGRNLDSQSCHIILFKMSNYQDKNKLRHICRKKCNQQKLLLRKQMLDLLGGDFKSAILNITKDLKETMSKD